LNRERGLRLLFDISCHPERSEGSQRQPSQSTCGNRRWDPSLRSGWQRCRHSEPGGCEASAFLGM